MKANPEVPNDSTVISTQELQMQLL